MEFVLYMLKKAGMVLAGIATIFLMFVYGLAMIHVIQGEYGEFRHEPGVRTTMWVLTGIWITFVVIVAQYGVYLRSKGSENTMPQWLQYSLAAFFVGLTVFSGLLAFYFIEY